MAEDIVLTRSGKAKIEDELRHLKEVEMPELSERIRQARALGDLSENFDYQDAKRQQGFINGRIVDLQAILDRAKVVEEAASGAEVVGLGSTVTLRDLDYDDEFTYKLVGANESDPSNGKISVLSPIGKAMMGKRVGAKIDVETPDGQSLFEIIAVS